MKEEKELIYLIGAFERDNIGDIIFPHIVKKCLPKYQFILISPIFSNLRKIGGDYVVSKKNIKLINKKPKCVIYCGGETITCNMEYALEMDSLISSNTANSKIYTKYLTSDNNNLGYLYDHKSLNISNKVPMGSISIGGSNENNYKNEKFNKLIKRLLNEHKIIIVRDKFTKNYIKHYLNIDSNISPDIVSLISETHIEKIKKEKNNIDCIKKKEPYIVFQANKDFIDKNNFKKIAIKISEFAIKNKKNIVLLPAGLAKNHDSMKYYIKIENFLKKQNKIKTFIFNDKNIWRKIALLSESYCNICTSLHFKIISDSFLIPSICLENQKVLNYLKSWPNKQHFYCQSIKDISKFNKQIENFNKSKFKEYEDQLKEKTLENLELFFKRMNLNYSFEFTKNKESRIDDKSYINFLLKNLENDQQTILNFIDSNSNLFEELNIIKSSKFFKLWPIYCKLKKILKINETK